MWIVGLNRQHNSSVCLLKDGEIIFHSEEERHSRFKADSNPFLALNKIYDYTDHIDELCVAGFSLDSQLVSGSTLDYYATVLSKTLKKPFNWVVSDHNHHEQHAACAFYNSGFESSLCVIVDGNGSWNQEKRQQEIESIYHIEYPAKITLLYKRYSSDDYCSSGWMFEGISDYFGLNSLDAGKVMGMSSYGKLNNSLPNLLDGSLFKIDRSKYLTNESIKFVPEGYNKDFQTMSDLALQLQNVTQDRVLGLIYHALSLHPCKNVCISGGYGLNCVANYHYVGKLPDDVNLYCEPISNDAGTSIGLAKLRWHELTGDKTIRKQKNVYHGIIYDSSNIKINDDEKLIDVSYKDVVSKLIDGDIVSLYQGGAESGPRSLGNRSILLDPRIKNGKDFVNEVKNREWYRPFAGTILKQYVHEWFDMKNLTESPFMMYAVNILPEKKDTIPSIVHVDNTCRIQTLERDFNPHYYNLIEEFYKQTGVPILFNTSFNLAGEPLVETIEDALNTFRNSKMRYLYFPEQQKLLCKI